MAGRRAGRRGHDSACVPSPGTPRSRARHAWEGRTTRQALLSAPQRCLLGARMPPHQAWTGPSPGPPRLSLPRAHAPGISQALEGTPALEASPHSDSTAGVCHAPCTRGLQAVHILTREILTTPRNQYTILAVQRRSLRQRADESCVQGHTAPKWYSLDLNSGSPARVHSLNHIKSSSLPRAVQRTEQNAFLVAPCTLQGSNPCPCKSSNCSVHCWGTWQAAVMVSDGGCHEGPGASTKAARWEKPPGLSQQSALCSSRPPEIQYPDHRCQTRG